MVVSFLYFNIISMYFSASPIWLILTVNGFLSTLSWKGHARWINFISVAFSDISIFKYSLDWSPSDSYLGIWLANKVLSLTSFKKHSSSSAVSSIQFLHIWHNAFIDICHVTSCVLLLFISVGWHQQSGIGCSSFFWIIHQTHTYCWRLQTLVTNGFIYGLCSKHPTLHSTMCAFDFCNIHETGTTPDKAATRECQLWQGLKIKQYKQ